jgi:hypothetical protein
MIKIFGGIMSFLVLLFVSGGLYVRVIMEAYRFSLWLGFFMSFLLVGFLYQFRREVKTLKEQGEKFRCFVKEDLYLFIWVLISTFTTFTLSNDLGVGPILASSIVGIIGSVFLRRFMVPIFSGTFVGMISGEIINHYGKLFIAAVIAAILFILFKRFFEGVGGKLGTIAFCGGLFIIFVTGERLISENLPSNNVSLTVIFCTVVGTLGTYSLNHRFKLGPVLASGLVGILGGLFFRFLYPELAGILTAAIYSSSFVGMSSEHRFPNISALVLAGLVVGVVFIMSIPYFGGVGGKIGTVAFVSSLSVEGVFQLKTVLGKMSKLE